MVISINNYMDKTSYGDLHILLICTVLKNKYIRSVIIYDQIIDESLKNASRLIF